MTLMFLEMFSELDSVFMHEDAFSDCKKSLGRLYRIWKKHRAILDPEFDQKRYRRSLYD